MITISRFFSARNCVRRPLVAVSLRFTISMPENRAKLLDPAFLIGNFFVPCSGRGKIEENCAFFFNNPLCHGTYTIVLESGRTFIGNSEYIIKFSIYRTCDIFLLHFQSDNNSAFYRFPQLRLRYAYFKRKLSPYRERH